MSTAIKTFKKFSFLFIILTTLIVGACLTAIITYADTFYTVRIEYKFKDGTPAHDAYVAAYRSGANVNTTVTNPEITGFTPMTAIEGGNAALTTELNYSDLSENKNITVYYIAGLTKYRAMYYKQNIYDDLYTRDNTVNVRYTDRYGLTGTNPTELEGEANKPEGYEGFTNLFHEPDAIAADGSTVFRVYYDRNYYTVNFDLGSGGYGVDAVYAKYESIYHIGEPKRAGFNFKGWVLTNKDGDKFYDNNNVEIKGDEEKSLDEKLIEKAFEHHNGTVPAHNVYYKAIWEATTTKYSIVYWMENPNSTATLDQMTAQTTSPDLRRLVTANYSVVATKEFTNIPSGFQINYDNMVRDEDFFYTNVETKTKRNLETAFPSMSYAQKKELNGKGKYFSLNTFLTKKNFFDSLITGGEEPTTLPNKVVLGDGTTRINVYYDRKEFDLKFYYAKTDANNKVYLAESASGFGKSSSSSQEERLGSATWTNCVPTADGVPQIISSSTKITPATESYGSGNSMVTYYYYSAKVHYGGSLDNIWMLNAFANRYKKSQNSDTRKNPQEDIIFGGWAPQYGTNYSEGNKNKTTKGIFEKMDEQFMFKNDNRDDYLQVSFVGFWTNASYSSTWNSKPNLVFNFTYQNYVELLPYEYEKTNEELIAAGNYIDVIPNDQYNSPIEGKRYGLPAKNNFETYDAGQQYTQANIPKDYDDKDDAIRENQTAVSLQGFEIEDYQTSNGRVILNANNTIINWEDYGSDGNIWNDNHATIKFFYKRLKFTLRYVNGNTVERELPQAVAYNAPLNSKYATGEHTGEYRYFYEPEYFNPDLKDYFEFKGWYYTPYYYREVDLDAQTMPADDITFYAKWVPKVINVSFYPTYNDYYQNKNRIHCIPNSNYDPTKPICDPDDPNFNPDSDTPNVKWNDGNLPVNYGDFIPHNQIPANIDDDEHNLRPELNPPAQGAQFAGWYYLRDNVPVRFEPENLPVTALNYEASVHNGHLKLFAEWVTKDVAKYQVKYVEKDHPEREVATETTGRAFVFKTKTFNAKGGDQLNAAHAWEENGTNWWPTTNSTSILIKANAQGEEFKPNTCKFEYVQKQKVHYKIQYLDAASRTPLLPEVTRESGHASIEEDAPFIPGYAVTEGTKTLVLTASTAETEEEQEAEELATNVITFYYNKNSTEYIYEVEYYTQNTGDDNYTLAQKENLAVTIASQGDTTVSIANIYNRHIPSVFEQNGFTRKANATTVTETNGSVNTYGIADDANVVISPAHRTTIKVYYDRNTYYYSYKYVDHTQEKLYNDKLKNNESVDGVWDGVIQEFPNQGPARVETDVTISGERDITYNGTPYTRINTRDLTLNIAPVTPANPHVNEVKIYYKKFTERELQFKLSCKNENSPYTDVDYDHNTGDPLYGGISLPMQTVDSYSDIQSVEFYDFNEAKTSNGGVEYYIHNHKYNFLGWYDNPEGTGTPLTTNAILAKENLGLNESLPARDKTYYAVVEQVLVRANFEFRLVDEALPIGTGDGETEEDRQAAAIVAEARSDPNGDYTGSYFDFSAPSTYVNNTPVPWHRTDGYSMSIMPKDNRVYKYEFAEWWEEDLTVTPHKLIRKKNWNSSGEWSPTILQNQVTRNGDKHIIAVYKKRTSTDLPYTINYHFKTRLHGTKDFVVKGKLTSAELSANTHLNNQKVFELTDEFIMSKAPFEANYGETLCWKDVNTVKTSIVGNPSSDKDEEKVDRIITTVTAEQKIKTAYANYRLNPDSAFTQITSTIGANFLTDPKLAAIDATGLTYNDKAFSYWEIRKSSSASAEVVARCYDSKFSFCLMDTYYITPVFDSETGEKSAVLNPSRLERNAAEDWYAWTWNNDSDGVWITPDSNLTFTGLKNKVIFARVKPGETPVFDTTVYNKTADLDVVNGGTYTLTGWTGAENKIMDGTWVDIKLTHLDYSRNRWTDDNNEVPADGSTDELFTDFEIAYRAFNNTENDIFEEGSGYKTGVVFELCAQLPDSATFNPNRDYNQLSDETNLKAAIKNGVKNQTLYGTYNYKPSTNKKRSYQIKEIPTNKLTNRNRIQFSQCYVNNYTSKIENEVETRTYKNSTYLLKATAYLIDVDGETVTLSNSVYTCLKDVSKKDLASVVPGMTVYTEGN